MTNRPDIWMPLYVKDYLADTMHLTTAQHGAYLLLIMEYWRTAMPLPNDDAVLARKAKLSITNWQKMKHTVLPFFEPACGVLRHKRIDAELAEAAERYEKMRLRTAAATAARTQRNVQRNDTVTDNVTVTQPQPQPQPPFLRGENDLASRPLSPEMRKRLGVTLSDEKLAQLERENAEREQAARKVAG